MKNSIITFIGGGNMATSLIGGLLATGTDAQNIRVVDTSANPPAARYAVNCYTEVAPALEGAEVIVFAVKPQVLASVAKGLANHLTTPFPLIISVAAGIRSTSISQWLGNAEVPIVRVMPNTPSLVGSGASGLFANAHVSEAQHALAETILRAVGLTVWLDNEEQLDAVTALSGSGPAYYFLFMEMMEKTGVSLGLPKETARLLSLQTAFGAAKMALESEDDAATLRERVTSPGGTTEQALKVLQEGGLQTLFDKALRAAQQRAVTLAEQLGEQS